MGKKKTETKEVAKATTTPNVPDWIRAPLQGFTSRVQQFGQGDPQSLIAGPSQLQQQAFQRAGMLGGRQQQQMPPMQNLAMAPLEGGGVPGQQQLTVEQLRQLLAMQAR